MIPEFVKRVACLALVLAVAAPVFAQQKRFTLEEVLKMSPEQRATLTEAQLRDAMSVGLEKKSSLSQPFFRGAPGTSSGSPSAFGAVWRDAFIGGGVQQARGGGDTDGSIAGGFGLGNAKDAVGLEVVVVSLSTFRSGLFDRTAFSFKAHHMVSSSAAIAVGVENAVIAGGGKTDGFQSVFAAASKVLWPKSGPISQWTLSGGVGNGRFRFEKDALKDQKTINFFGSVGAQFHPQASVIADWSGQDLAVGLSVVPIKQFPVIITPAIADLTGQNGNDPRFTLGFGLGIRF